MLERGVDPRSSEHPHLHQSSVTQLWNQCDLNPHLPDSVADGEEMLDRLEGEGGGLVGEAVHQGLLQGQVGRVQGLEDVRLQTVAEEAWWQNMVVLC